ncbi:helicase-like transcription factor CHR28, partial [Tanacetum coccineum]
SIPERDKAVKDFKRLPEVSVMIMSLKAASLGLNMVAANHVLLLDLWWNPTTEEQAIDRAHRIGQTRPVKVMRLTVEKTVEDRILKLQKKKKQIVACAFGEDEEGRRLSVNDLRYLFRVPIPGIVPERSFIVTVRSPITFGEQDLTIATTLVKFSLVEKLLNPLLIFLVFLLMPLHLEVVVVALSHYLHCLYLVPNTVAPQTRSNPAVTDEILAGLRDPVTQMMREEMEKLTDEMRANAMEASTSTLVINQGDQRKTIQFIRAPRLSFQNLVVRMLTGGCTSFMRLIGDILPWLVFRGAIMQRFGNPIDDPLAELKICKFETSVEDYQNAYDKLLSRVDISEDQAIRKDIKVKKSKNEPKPTRNGKNK